MVFFCVITDSEHWILFLTVTRLSPTCKRSGGGERPSPGWGPQRGGTRARTPSSGAQCLLHEWPGPGRGSWCPTRRAIISRSFVKNRRPLTLDNHQSLPLAFAFGAFGVSKGNTLKSWFDESSATGTKTLCFVCKMRINSTGLGGRHPGRGRGRGALAFPWNESYDKHRQHIKKQRYYFANKGLSRQSYGFSSSHVWMWESDHKEAWGPRNWCFLIVLEKTLESPLDCKEKEPVNPKGNQPWISLEGLMLKLKFQYFGHLMWRANSTCCSPWGHKELDTTDCTTKHPQVSIRCQVSSVPMPLIA